MTDDEIFVEVCGMVEEEFVVDPQKVFNLVGKIKNKSKYGGQFTLSILHDYTSKGLMKKEEFIRGVRSICTGEIEESVAKRRDRKGRSKSGKRKKLKSTVTGRMKVVCQLDGAIYHNNKSKFHKLADKYDMERKGGWNKDLNAAILHWRMRDDSETINGFFIRDGSVTKKATLTWRGEKNTSLVKDFINFCDEMGGELDDSELKARVPQSSLLEFG